MNVIDGCQEDKKIKKARYVGKTNDINQELYFSHPTTEIQVNKIWNTHFTGSPLCNLFSEGSRKIEASYNKSIKYMLNLPHATHRSLIETLSGEKHIKMVLLKRFVSFMERIDKSSKSALKILKQEALKNVQSITGTNYWGIMLLIGERWTSERCLFKIQKIFEYRVIPQEDQWKLDITEELSDVMNGDGGVEGFNFMELKDIFEVLCVSHRHQSTCTVE